MKIAAIIPAAGTGRRVGGIRKAFMLLDGKPMLQYSIEVFRSHVAIQTVVVALAAEDFQTPPDWLSQAGVVLVQGGLQRAESVRAALNALDEDTEGVIVHDAARPLVNADMIDRVLAKLTRGRSATLGLQVTDTLHLVNHDFDIRDTPDRSEFWRAQTPQAFPRDVLEMAFAASPDPSTATDEAGLVAAGGWRVNVVPGEPWNIKVTTPADIAIVESALRDRVT